MMFKRLVLITTLSLFSISTFSQVAKKEGSVTTKMDVFTSKTGSIIKIVDTKLPKLKTTYNATVETRIRKISNGAASAYFFQIVKSNSIASIEYSDLIELLKALQVLKNEINSDITSNPDYLDNTFTTTDGFQMGYFCSGGKTSWYLKLDKSGSDNTLFISDSEVIETSFTEAKNKMAELKK
ncbi:hypothetical protein [Flavobacterium sp.]|uniref:hypothetical protein n=1 Tax=Flavobacterium sp. TaxID=239 RepID=UPI00261374CB|nr:hypothetical protein [Flavobacterium sp.]